MTIFKNLSEETKEKLRQAFLCGVHYADNHPKEEDEGLGDENIDEQLSNWIKGEDPLYDI